MKRRLPVLFLLVLSFSFCLAQQNILIQAPPQTATTTAVFPTGLSSQAYMRGCFLIKTSELSALTGSVLNAVGFYLGSGGNAAVSGTMTFYLENSNDQTYLKGTNYGAAVGAMTQVYTGNMTIPAGTGTANILMPMQVPFNYNGASLYVAYDWASTGPFVTTYARPACNTTSVIIGGYRFATSVGAIGTLNSSSQRPVCLFDIVNQASNEAGVEAITAPGKVAEGIHQPHVISALIKNSSIGSLSNLSVGLNVSGANNFNDTQTIPSLAAGAVATVTFAPFNPGLLGVNTVMVSLPADDNNGNNSKLWTQNVTCNQAANNPPTTSALGSIGFPSGTGILTTRFEYPGTSTLSAISMGVAYDFNADQKPVCGVLMNGITGNIIATTNTVILTTANMGTTMTFTFSSPKALSANTPYNIGMAQIQAGYRPLYYAPADALYTPGQFFWCPLAGGGFNVETQGYYMIEPIFDAPKVNIAQTSTAICYGQSINLSASGANSYTWTSSIFNPVDTPNNSEITVKPESNEIYTVTASDDAGCVGTTQAVVAVKLCLVAEEYKELADGINLFPNPTNTNMTTISGLQQNCRIMVYDIVGVMVMDKKNEATTYCELDLNVLAPGNYIVRVQQPDQSMKTIKLIRQ